ncbi:hypothetical protein RRF57_000716 [Xylaria bambusicola]|uniref:Azaphilone pigments biosynthesis cluster protein L N-terminal domain-containing protein n=1 Tax=Xylaria bambusicola TaxID=326684 RepID=A0AAN7U4C3_9PEZI
MAMADIVSIAFGAIAATQKTSISLFKFVRGCKEARDDLAGIAQQLSELTLVLELIKESSDVASESLPETLQSQLKAILASCEKLVQGIEELITSCKGRAGVVQWTLLEKEKVKAMGASLEAFKGGLNLALDTANLIVATHIKNDTNAIHHNTTEIKRDTEAILEEIQRLRIHLPSDRPLDEKRIQLEAWLDDLTQYAATVADGEVVDNFDDVNGIDVSILARNRQNSEAIMIVQKDVLMPSIQTTLGGEYCAKYSTEPSSVNLKEESSNSSYLTAFPIIKSVKSASGMSPSRLIASLPCASRLIGIDGNAERQICASIHDDGVVRIWSMQTKRLSKRLKSSFLISSTVWIAICPANPDILIIYDYKKASKPGKLNIEAWNWVEDSKIHIVINTKFTPETGYFFVPFSHVVYTRTTTNDLIIIDLDVSPGRSSTGQSVSLSDLAISASRDAIANRGSLFRFSFVSDNEIAVIWRRTRRRGLLRGSPESDYFCEVARLSSIAPEDDQEKPLVSERYSPSIISHARVISKFRLPSEARIVDMKVVPERQIVLIFATRKSPELSSASRVVYAMKLETGEALFSYDCPINWTSTPAMNSCVGFKDHDFCFHGVSLIDGSELAELNIIGTILFENAEYIVSALRMQSGIGFWKTQKPQALQDIGWSY